MAVKLLKPLFGHALNVIVRDISYDIERRLVEAGAASYTLAGGSEQIHRTVSPGLSAIEQNLLSQKQTFDVDDNETPFYGETSAKSLALTDSGVLADGLALTSGQAAVMRAGMGIPLNAPNFYVATVIGDSIEAGSTGFTSESAFTAGNTWFEYVCVLSKGRIIRRKNAGIGSNTSAQMLARFDADVPANTTLGIIKAGTNDIGVLTEDQTISNNREIVRKYFALGCVDVVVTALPPKDTALYQTHSINRRLALMAEEEGARFVNPWSSFISGTGGWVAGAAVDATHPNETTAFAAATEWLRQFFQSEDGAPAENSVFPPKCNADPQTKLYISATANSCFMTDSDANGVPDGWTAIASEITHSLENLSAPAVGKAFRITGASISATRMTQRAIVMTTYVPGARYVLVFRVSTVLNSGACTGKVVFLAAGLTINAFLSMTKDLTNALVVIPWTCPAAPTAGYLQASLIPVAGTTSGTLDISQAEIYLASDLGVDL